MYMRYMYHIPLLTTEIHGINQISSVVILSAKWPQGRPYLSGGPYEGNYTFAQVHFHWGENEMKGSEHTVDGARFEIYFKSFH